MTRKGRVATDDEPGIESEVEIGSLADCAPASTWMTGSAGWRTTTSVFDNVRVDPGYVPTRRDTVDDLSKLPISPFRSVRGLA